MSGLIMGLDTSTRTGVAIINSATGAIVMAKEIEFKKLSGFPRVQALVQAVMDIHEEYKPDHVCIEEMFVGQASSAICTIQIGSLIRFVLWQEGIKYFDVPASTLKKFISDNGSATKEQVMMHLFKRTGYEAKTNNIADAVNAAMFCQALMGAKVPLTARKVVTEFMKKISHLQSDMQEYILQLTATAL